MGEKIRDLNLRYNRIKEWAAKLGFIWMKWRSQRATTSITKRPQQGRKWQSSLKKKRKAVLRMQRSDARIKPRRHRLLKREMTISQWLTKWDALLCFRHPGITRRIMTGSRFWCRKIRTQISRSSYSSRTWLKRKKRWFTSSSIRKATHGIFFWPMRMEI